ncbi:MAG: cytochrome c [Chitinophagaceae bacterium]|nr:cytochrome c [Chitinophagaceae bacterium]
MKRIILLLSPVVFFSCMSNKKPEPFDENMLASQLFTINTEKETTLKTLHGSLVTIDAGSFSIDGQLTLEIREAFSAAEILAAGLITESNGKPLRSGGMIYINTAEKDTAVTLLKPIKVSIPNDYYDPGMQIFKGAETDSGTINWTAPEPADTTPQMKNWIIGKTHFAKCTPCHSIFTDGTGPALTGVETRGPWKDRKKIHEYISNPASFMAGDPYTQDLKRKFGSMMTAFPDLGQDGVNAILDYIKNETNRPGAKEEEKWKRDSLTKVWEKESRTRDSISNQSDSGFYNSTPCGNDTIYISTKNEQSFFNMEEDIPAMDTAEREPVSPESLEGLRRGFTDPNPTNGMYDFEIKTLGWYNVDAYVEGYPGTVNVKLEVLVSSATELKMEQNLHIYLFIPRNKMLSVLNAESNGRYYFDKIKDGIPLFLDERAILFAFGSKGRKMYYGINEFRIKKEQIIEINIKETTEEKIRAALYSSKIEGIELGIEKKEEVIIERDCGDKPARPDSSQ